MKHGKIQLRFQVRIKQAALRLLAEPLFSHFEEPAQNRRILYVYFCLFLMRHYVSENNKNG